MNKKYFNVIIATIVLAAMTWSCNKDDSQIVTTIEDDSFRVLKVEVLEPYYPYFPFYNNLALVEYDYKSDGELQKVSVWCSNSKTNCDLPSNTVFPWNGFTWNVESNTSSTVNFSVADKPFNNLHGYHSATTNVSISRKNGVAEKMETTIGGSFALSPFLPELWKVETSVSRNVEGKLDALSSKILPFAGAAQLQGSERNILIRETIDGLITEVTYFENYTHMQSISDVSFEETTSKYQYVLDESIPKELVSLINQSILRLFPSGFEENLVHHYNSDHGSISDNTSFADWIFLFGKPNLSLLELNQQSIVSSVSTTGRRLQIYRPTESEDPPIYETINETKTFPYTHDPINKTLTINGIKIYYQSPGN
jgi:hypothetical protein